MTSDGELAALRARAYGPDADIHDDPAALRRWQELETRARHASAIHGDSTPARSQRETVPAGEATMPLSAGLGLPSDEERETEGPAARTAPEGPPAPSRARRRWALLWAASVLAASAITAVVVGAVTAHDPAVVMRLAPSPDAELPEMWQAEAHRFEDWAEPHRYEDYLGVAVMSYFGAPADQYLLTCLAIMAGSDYLGSECSRSGLDPIVEVTVTPTFPEAFREQHDRGTTLRFTREGSHVIVRAYDEPTADTE